MSPPISHAQVGGPAGEQAAPIFVVAGQPSLLVDPAAAVLSGSLKVRGKVVTLKPTAYAIAPLPAKSVQASRSPLDLWLFDTTQPWSVRPLVPGDATAVTLASIPPDVPPESFGVPVFKLTDVDAGMAILRAAAGRLPAILRDTSCSWWPTEAWRLDLLAGESNAVARPSPIDPALAAWAVTTRLSVASGIGRIAAADADLAEQVARAILQTGSVPLAGDESVVVPVWADAASIDGLLRLVLSSDRSPEQVRDAARAWLSQQPEGLAWVVSDAGLRDGVTSKRVATISLLSLRSRILPSLRSTDPGARLSAAFEALLPGAGYAASIILRADGNVARGDPGDVDRAAKVASGGVPVELSMGSRTVPITLALRPALLRPPGFTMAPALEDWTMPTLRAGALRTSGGVSGVVLFDGQPRRLKVVFQSRLAGPSDVQEITLCVGPPGGGATRVTVDSTGKVTGGDAVVVSGPTLWSAAIEVPERAIEPDQSIRIGWMRTDAAGRRLSWPRPMLPAPWQTEPARVAIDLQAWDEGFGADDTNR